MPTGKFQRGCSMSLKAASYLLLCASTGVAGGRYCKSPVASSIGAGNVAVRIERKGLFRTTKWVYVSQLSYYKVKDSSRTMYLRRTEGLNHPGVEFTAWSDGILMNSSTYDTTLRTEHSNWARACRTFDDNYFYRCVLKGPDTVFLSSAEHWKDTLLFGESLRWFSRSAVASSVNGDSRSGVTLYYTHPGSATLCRIQSYVFAYGDTQYVDEQLLAFQVGGITLRDIRRTIRDTLKMLRAKMRDVSGQSRGRIGMTVHLPRIGETFPDVELRKLDGEAASLKEFPESYILLDFAYNSCLPCHLSIPALRAVQHEFGGSAFTVVTVNPKDDSSQIMRRARVDSIDYPIVRSSVPAVSMLGVTSYPTFFLLGPDRTVLWMQQGAGGAVLEEITNAIQSAGIKK